MPGKTDDAHPFDLSSGFSSSPLLGGSRRGSMAEGRKDSMPQEEGTAGPSYRSWTRQQVIPCLLIYAGMVSQLLCFMMIGPALLDLQQVTQTSIQQASWFLSARAMGALLGCIILTYTMELRYYWMALTGALFMSGLAFTIVPWVANFSAVVFLFILMGVGMGYFITGGMLSIFSIWTDRKDSVSWLNGGQLMFLIGGFMGPLIVKPFFASSNVVPVTNVTDVTNGTQSGGDNATAIIDLLPGVPSDGELPPGGQTHIMWAFLIGGAMVTLTSAAFLLADRLMGGIRFTMRNPTKGGPDTRRRLLPLKTGLIILLFLFHVITSVIVRTYASYIVTFTVNYLDWSKAKGSVLTSFIFLAALVGKFACIFVVRVVRTELQLFVGLAINIVGAGLLMFFINEDDSVIWICSLVIAVGDANITATILAWTDTYMGIKGIVGALYNIGGTVGEIIAAPLVGWLFEDVSYEAFLYIIALATLLNLVFMGMLQLMGMRYRRLVDHYRALEEEEQDNDHGQRQGQGQGQGQGQAGRQQAANEKSPILDAKG